MRGIYFLSCLNKIAIRDLRILGGIFIHNFYHFVDMRHVLSNTSNTRCKVYLVGAGPGDPGLFTLKGKEVLQQADVVIFDYLANPELLKFAPLDAEMIDAGKRHGNHTIPQTEINQLIFN